MVNEFKRGVNVFLDQKNRPTNLIEDISLMQHFGVPTRFLDFTYSPYVAAYFAFEKESKNTKHVAIWAIDKQALWSKVTSMLYGFFKEKLDFSKIHYIDNDMFNSIFTKNNLDIIFKIEPFLVNERYLAQHSAFVSVGNSSKPFMEQISFLGDELSKIMYKFKLPYKIRNEVLEDLNKMNINPQTLFPGLEGFAKNINFKFSLEKDIPEYLEGKNKEGLIIEKLQK